jgi:hypothetical protein
MKKLLIMSVCVMAATFSFAQIKNDKGTFTKPMKGDWAFETEMAINTSGGSFIKLNDPFLGNLASGMTLPSGNSGGAMLKARKFKSAKVAERYLLNVSFSSMNTKTTGATTTGTEFGVALGYGREKHFAGAERLSTYIGWEVLAGLDNISNKAGSTTTQTGFGVAVQGLTGMDYYIVPKVYLGVELGWGIGFNSYGKVTGGTTTSSSFSVAPLVVPVFRLGYRL